MIQPQSDHDFIYDKLSKGIKAVDSEVIDPAQPDNAFKRVEGSKQLIAPGAGQKGLE